MAKNRMKRRGLIVGLLLAATALLPVGSPQTRVLAAAPLYELQVQNQENNGEQAFVMGARYRLTRTQGAYDPESQSFAVPEGALAAGVELVLEAGTTLPAAVNGSFVPNPSKADEGYLKLMLPEGRYSLAELTPAPGYLPWSNDLYGQQIRFDLPRTNSAGTGYEERVRLVPKAVKILGHLTLNKIDPDREAGEQALAGALFRLEQKSAGGAFAPYALGEGGAATSDFTTDARGQIKLTNLPAGDYRLVEYQAPSGYIRDSKPLAFTIAQTTNSQTQVLESRNYRIPSVSKWANGEAGHETAETAYVVGRETDFPYQLKLSLSSDLVNYEQLEIRDVLHANLRSDEALSSLTIKDEANTDLSGLFESELEGTTLVVKGKTGLADWKTQLTSTRELNLSFTTRVKAEDTGQTAIANDFSVRYAVADQSGGQAGGGGNPLPPAAPSLTKSPLSGEVRSAASYVRVRNGALTITKVDAEDTRVKLPGIEFSLAKTAAPETELRRGTTDKEGLLSFTGLDYGDYLLTEQKTLSGYRLLTKPLAISLEQEVLGTSDVPLSVTVKNFRTAEFPLTGTLAMLGYGLAGALLLVLGYVVWHRGRKKEGRE